MSDQFDAWNESESPKKPERSSRTTGMILIGGVFAMIVCLLGLLIGLNFGIMRPAQERAISTQEHAISSTATAEADATARVQATLDYLSELVEPPSDWELILEEPFNDNERWLTGIEDTTFGITHLRVNDGIYGWEVSGGNVRLSPTA